MTTHAAHTKPKIGITIGDLNGIGPEIIIKALADSRILNLVTPVVYGSARVLSYYRKLMNLEEFNYSQVKAPGQFFPKAVNVVNCWDEVIELQPGTPSQATARAALLALTQAVKETQAGWIDGFVTAPIDKKTIYSEAFPYRGHTEYLTEVFQATESLMMMVGPNLKVGVVSEHVALKDVARLITKERVELKIRLLEYALKKDFGVQKPKIAVLGLNPHAGDEGLIGTEENEIIRPVILDLKNKGKLVMGPFPADGFFAAAHYLRYDAILAMYHDQGLVPFKQLCFEQGVNFTAGLPIVRTSPDHGTAYAIAGKNQADESSLREAIYLANSIIQQRHAQAAAGRAA
jgi:4-hydroxythreonine-4-phosphate dehydrogenase